jgi:Fe-S-cluster containining protein
LTSSPSARMLRAALTSLDCCACGACCIANWDAPTYVWVSPSDEAQLTKSQRKRLVTWEDGPGHVERGVRVKKNSQGHIVCKALIGKVGVKVRCGVYESRPSVCRQFSPGGAVCRSAREDALG